MQEYITYGAKENRWGRKITVVKIDLAEHQGLLQPFYLSTGLNSKLGDCWLPFILARGTFDRSALNWKALPGIYDQNLVNGALDEIEVVLGESSKENLIKTSTLLSEFKLKENKSFTGELAERLGTKEFLIISARLNEKYYSDQQLEDAGLNPEEIAAAKQPIGLKNSGFYTNDPNGVNFWLITQGVAYVKKILPSISEVPDSNIEQVCLPRSPKFTSRDDFKKKIAAPQFGTFFTHARSEEKEIKSGKLKTATPASPPLFNPSRTGII